MKIPLGVAIALLFSFGVAVISALLLTLTNVVIENISKDFAEKVLSVSASEIEKNVSSLLRNSLTMNEWQKVVAKTHGVATNGKQILYRKDYISVASIYRDKLILQEEYSYLGWYQVDSGDCFWASRITWLDYKNKSLAGAYIEMHEVQPLGASPGNGTTRLNITMIDPSYHSYLILSSSDGAWKKYDPRTRSWFMATLKLPPGSSWLSDMYAYNIGTGDYPLRLYVSIFSSVVNEEKKVIALTSTDFELTQIGDFIRRSKISDSGSAFLIQWNEGQEEEFILLAHSSHPTQINENYITYNGINDSSTKLLIEKINSSKLDINDIKLQKLLSE